MSSVCSKEIIFWGAIVSLSAIITGSCYYLLQQFSNEESDEQGGDPLKNNKDLVIESNSGISEEAAVRIMLQIEQLAEKEYQKSNESFDKQRRAITNHSSNEYFELCKETLMKKQSANEAAAKKVLQQLKPTLTFEDLNEKIRLIPPEKLESLSLSLYVPDKDEAMPSVDIAKEAYMLYTQSFLAGMESINAKYQNSTEAEVDQQLLELMMLKIQIDDQINMKYNTNDRLARLVLSKEHKFITDPELKALKEKMKSFEQMA